MLGLLSIGAGGFGIYVGIRDRRSYKAILAATSVDQANLPIDGAIWNPGSTVTDHLGRSLPSDRDFFVPPPPDIGTVVRAWSSLRQGVRSRGLEISLTGTIVAAATGFALLWYLFQMLEPNEPDVYITAAVFGALSGIASCWYVLHFKHECSYVGTQGVARFLCSYRRDHLIKAEVFSFRNALEFRKAELTIVHSGVVPQIQYRFDWYDGGGEICFQITGDYYFRPYLGSKPWYQLSYQWGISAEIAWTNSIMEFVQDELTREGAARFNLFDGDYLRVGPGFVEAYQAGRETRLPAADVEKLTVKGGECAIQTRRGVEVRVELE